MAMEIRPIFSTLMRNKVGPILIGLQIALTLAIVVNALFIINDRLSRIDRPSGVAEADIFRVSTTWFDPNTVAGAAIDTDLRYLRQLPGVVDAYASNTLPLSNGGWSSGIRNDPDPDKDGTSSAIYFADDHAVNTLGVKLIAGRNFTEGEIQQYESNKSLLPTVVLMSQKMAERMYPDTPVEQLVGKRAYFNEKTGDAGAEIVGIIERLQAPWVGWDEVLESVTLVPYRTATESRRALYIIRAAPGQRDELMKSIEEKLTAIDPGRILSGVRSFEQIRTEGYQGDAAMAKTLIAIISALLTITGLGIVGMASFWVTQRTKQIGTRRALGATRPNIVRYFLIENFLITGLGLALGVLLAYGLNIWLVTELSVARLPWYYVPIGAVALWALGQLAALGPAARAARVSPSVATRSV
jgi:putative ABC transport system permease protein